MGALCYQIGQSVQIVPPHQGKDERSQVGRKAFTNMHPVCQYVYRYVLQCFPAELLQWEYYLQD